MFKYFNFVDYALTLEPPSDWQFMNQMLDAQYHWPVRFAESFSSVLNSLAFEVEYRFFPRSEFIRLWSSRGVSKGGEIPFSHYSVDEFIAEFDKNPVSNSEFLLLPIHQMRFPK